jgi:hypothetical protein
MAIELKGTIELTDITAIEFRCICGRVSIRKLDNRLEVPTSCGNTNCDSQWQKNDCEALQTSFRTITSFAAKDCPSLRFHLEGLEGFIAARPKP